MASEKERTQDALKDAIRAQLSAKPAAPKDHGNRQRLTTAGLWVRPFHSDALGVNPAQIKAAEAELRKHGCTAEFDKEGRCIITSEKQYQQVAKISGLKTGRDGYDNVKSGRDNARGQEEFRRAVERGDYD